MKSTDLKEEVREDVPLREKIWFSIILLHSPLDGFEAKPKPVQEYVGRGRM